MDKTSGTALRCNQTISGKCINNILRNGENMLGQLEEEKLLQTSINFLKGHDIINAEKACLSVLDSNDKCAVSYYLLSKIRIRQGRFEQSKEILWNVLTLDPANND